MRKIQKYKVHALFALFFVIAGVLGFLGYQTRLLWDENASLIAELRTTQNNLEATSVRLSEVIQTLAETNENLSLTKAEQEQLEENLAREQERVSESAAQLADISGTVGTLEKLRNTDEELLQKYSKVYFLNEHYIPQKLSKIDDRFLHESKDDLQIHASVLPYLEDLLNAAAGAGTNMRVISSYRSFDRQEDIKATYRIIYGAGTANQFSADQGYSEHQLGTTVDFTTTDTGILFEAFKHTKAYTWLEEHAHEYGFTLSYPEGNDYYISEPWHWRYVGKELATHLKNEGKHFYDLDQREIDEYLVNIFD